MMEGGVGRGNTECVRRMANARRVRGSGVDGRRGIAAGDRQEVHREIGWQITGLSPSMREDVAADASDGERTVDIDDGLWSA